ncbi:MAG: branched-chain amino acid transaminase [Helicobacteraceae bacterium]
MLKEAKYIWKNGEFVNWRDATVHVLSHTLHYGNGVFEGTRAYQTKDGLAIFKLQEHTKRLFDSAKIVAIEPNFTQDDFLKAQVELLQKNDFKGNVYIRPIIFLGYGVMGLFHAQAPVESVIAAWEWGAYLGEEGLEKGIRVKTASVTRNSIRSNFGRAKSVGGYLNSQMAKYEAFKGGYEEALFLADDGTVSEGSGECIFIVRGGKLITPPNIWSLESITQASVIELAQDLNITVERRNITRDEIYIADEAFFTGTAAEITPIRELDDRTIGSGSAGEMTKRLQKEFFDMVYGRNPAKKHYLTYI